MSLKKEELLERIITIKSMVAGETHKNIYDKLNALATDIEADTYNIVVMGEFKRGKSTFVNALLGKEILPTDVLPETTTINRLHYSEDIGFSVYYRNGEVKSGKNDIEILKDFSAQNKDFDADAIQYVDVGYPSEYLKGNISIIDTPGVSDINEQRCEITYEFVPKANAVIFLLDATSPLKKTEVEFIEDKLLAIGIDNIIFVLNKYDLIDEEEDENLIEETKARLKASFTQDGRLLLEDITLIPFSAKDALEGIQHNMAQYETSGMNELKEVLIEMFSHSRIEKDKLKGFNRRLEHIIKEFISKLEQERCMQKASVEDLQKMSEALQDMVNKKKLKKGDVSDYIDSSSLIILEMTNKSLENFKETLWEDVLYQIEQNKSMDFKQLIEIRLGKLISTRTQNWFGINGKKIDTLLDKLVQEVSNSISLYFQHKVNLGIKKGKGFEKIRFDLNLQGTDYTRTVNIQSGLTMAGGAALAMLAASSLLPILSFLAATQVKTFFANKKIESVKAEITPYLYDRIGENVNQMKKTVASYVDDRISYIKDNSEAAFDYVLDELKQNVDRELANKKEEKEKRYTMINTIDENILELEKMLLSVI